MKTTEIYRKVRKPTLPKGMIFRNRKKDSMRFACRSKSGYTLVELTIVLAALFFALTWVTNAIRFINCDFEAPYKAEVIYGIGIFTPTCIVTAFIDLE